MAPKKVVKKASAKSTAPMSKSKRKIIAIVAGALVVLGGALAAAIALWPVKPPDPKESLDNAVKFVASDNFKKMPKNEQFAYMESMGEDRRAVFEASRNLPEADRDKFRENMGRAFMAQRTKELAEFFKKSKEEQNAELDRDIARMKEWEKARAARNTSGNNQPGPGGPGGGNRPPRTPPSAQQMRERDAASNPASRAMMQVKRAMMQQRAAQTGK
ncbi:MAG: hypothetical protein AB7F32_12170 [Victivallaceae bacterium]